LFQDRFFKIPLPQLLNFPVLTSIDVSASVSSMTIYPPDFSQIFIAQGSWNFYFDAKSVKNGTGAFIEFN